MDCLNGEDQTIERPTEYQVWRDYVPALKPAWSRRLLSWTIQDPIELSPRIEFDPDYEQHGADGGLRLYRRIAGRRNFTREHMPATSAW
jgi:hypothetical protein